MPSQCEQFLPGFYIPQSHCLVTPAAGNPLAIWAESHATDKTCVSGEGPYLLARIHIPDLHRIVATAAGDSLSVGRSISFAWLVGATACRLADIKNSSPQYFEFYKIHFLCSKSARPPKSYTQTTARLCCRQRSTSSAIFASPTHMTVSAPPQ